MYIITVEEDHLGRAAEITEGNVHCRRLRMSPARLKPIYSGQRLLDASGQALVYRLRQRDPRGGEHRQGADLR